jgi:hypothetical protein
MITTSESLSPPETSNGRAAEGNCVAVRRGGEQPEADPQTQTKVKPIRPATLASLLGKGEACGASHDRSDREASLKVRIAGVEGGWAGYAGKLSWWTVETCAGRRPLRRFRAGVRAAIVAGKRGNARGAKGGRERHLPAGTMPCRPVLSITLWVRKTRPTAPRGNVLGLGEVNRSLTPRGAGPAAPASHASPVSDRPPQGVSRPRRSWRAVCGKSARTVRRGERGILSLPRSYPIRPSADGHRPCTSPLPVV